MVIRYSYHSKRYAFTMIELIFAIVIIAIAVLSLPIMSGVNQKAIEDSIVQEAIFAASAELMDASAGYWDERSMEDIGVSQFSRVIDIGGDCSATTKLRPGHIAQSLHRRCLESSLTNNLDLDDNSTIYSLNDTPANSNLFDFTTSSDTTSASGYKNTYTSNMVVTRNGEVKTIVATISDTDGVVVKLEMQSANIGEVDYYKRTF